MLDLLEFDTPQMIATHSTEGGFWCAFDARADRIEECTEPSELEATRRRIEATLRAHQKNPASDVPCDG